LRFWRESSLIIPKNYDAPRRHGIPLPMLSSQTRFSYCLTGPKGEKGLKRLSLWRAAAFPPTRPGGLNEDLALVSPQQECRRHRDAHRISGLEVDYQLGCSTRDIGSHNFRLTHRISHRPWTAGHKA
jgi:hypothetical protein